MAVSSLSFGPRFPYDGYSDPIDPNSVARLPKDVPLTQDFKITLPNSTLCSLLKVKTVVVKEGTVVNAEGTGWGFLAYEIAGKSAPCLYKGPIEKYDPHGYGSIHFSDGVGHYEGPFTHGVPGGFGVHKNTAGVMCKIGDIRFDVYEGGMEFVLHGIGEDRGRRSLKAGFFEHDRMEGPGIILRGNAFSAAMFSKGYIVDELPEVALSTLSFSFALERIEEKPARQIPVISYLGDIATGPPSGIPLASSLIIKTQHAQKEISRFAKDSILTGFDASGNTRIWGSCETPHFNLQQRKLLWNRLESRFFHFEPQGYGRKYCFNEAKNTETIIEGAFGPDPLGRADFLLHGFGRILDQEGQLVKTGFFQAGLLYGPGIRKPTPQEKERFPNAAMLHTFFKHDDLAGGPAIYYDANGVVIQKGFFTIEDSPNPIFRPISEGSF